MNILPSVRTNGDLAGFLDGLRSKAAGHDAQNEVTSVVARMESLIEEARGASPEAAISADLLSRVEVVIGVL